MKKGIFPSPLDFTDRKAADRAAFLLEEEYSLKRCSYRNASFFRFYTALYFNRLDSTKTIVYSKETKGFLVAFPRFLAS